MTRNEVYTHTGIATCYDCIHSEINNKCSLYTNFCLPLLLSVRGSVARAETAAPPPSSCIFNKSAEPLQDASAKSCMDSDLRCWEPQLARWPLDCSKKGAARPTAAL